MGQKKLSRYKFIFLLLTLMFLPSIGASAQKHITSHVTVTCYQPVKSQCDSKPLVTADGSKINLRHLKSGKIKWCAISRDLLYLFPKDKPKRIWIEGMGIYEVRDIMNKRFHHRVDILLHPKDSKLVYYNNVKIKILQ